MNPKDTAKDGETLHETVQRVCHHKWLPSTYKSEYSNVSPTYWVLQSMVCTECMLVKKVASQL